MSGTVSIPNVIQQIRERIEDAEMIPSAEILGVGMVPRQVLDRAYSLQKRTENVRDTRSSILIHVRHTFTLGIAVAMAPNDQPGTVDRLVQVEADIMRRLMDYDKWPFVVPMIDYIETTTGPAADNSALISEVVFTVAHRTNLGE